MYVKIRVLVQKARARGHAADELAQALVVHPIQNVFPTFRASVSVKVLFPLAPPFPRPLPANEVPAAIYISRSTKGVPANLSANLLRLQHYYRLLSINVYRY